MKTAERTDQDRLRSVFNQMKQRCTNPYNAKFVSYGARGIEVRFVDFPQFYEWAMAAGYQRGLSIDRIDNAGNYESGNCRWADARQQVRNRRITPTLTAFGETKSIADWVEDPRCQVGYTALAQRRTRRKGWSAEQMITLPAQANGKNAPSHTTPTHCPQGHDYAKHRVQNARGDHYCRQCNRDRASARYQANAEAIKAKQRAAYHSRKDRSE